MARYIPRVLIITYYWPPSSGSGVQRWMYFAKYLSDYGVTPVILTVDPKKASYQRLDDSFSEFVKDVEAHHTSTIEPLKLYSLLTSGSTTKGIPQGGAGSGGGFFKKVSRYIRGNVFIPDARLGWKRFAVKKAKQIIAEQKIDLIITTGPPHSTHLIGRVLKRKFNIPWMADFRDPWTEIYYNAEMLQSEKSKKKDRTLELSVLQEADHILTIGPSMKELLAQKADHLSEKISYIYNGYDQDKMNSVEEDKSQSYFILTFVGSLNDKMPHQAMSKALNQFITTQPDAKIKLRIAGNISEKFLDALSPQLDVDNIGYISHHEALRLMKSAHMLFTCLPIQDDSKIMISGKVMEYLATGNPILCIGDTESDAASLLARSGNSATYLPNNESSITQFLADNYALWEQGNSLKSEQLDIEQYSRKSTAKELAEVVRGLVGK